jgi:SAM-dependent methyltransferase
MSATNRSDVRHPDDFYATPAWATRAILRRLRVGPGHRVLEPGCGTGAILKEIVATGAHAVGIESHADRAAEAAKHASVACGDYLRTLELAPAHRYDLVLGNPPFKHAREFVEKALTQGAGVCMLLRLSWLASRSRADFHRAHPSRVFILPRRPSFTPDGKTDASEYAWFAWGFGGGTWEILDVGP